MTPMHRAYWLTFLLASLGAGYWIYVLWRQAAIPVAFWGMLALILGSKATRHLRGNRHPARVARQPSTKWQRRRETLFNVLVIGVYLLLAWLMLPHP